MDGLSRIETKEYYAIWRLGKMNEFDLVKLINMKEIYKKYNLHLNVKGFVKEEYDKSSKIFFINEFNEGDYAFVEIFNEDLKLTKEQPPKQFVEFLQTNMQNFPLKEKGFKPRTFKAYQQVELMVEDKKYAKFGVHKGDVGTIMEDVAVQDSLLVDFGRLDENNNYLGDCISVKIGDIKLFERSK